MIHTFKFLDSYILTDVESGSIHLIDTAAYEVINSPMPYALGYDKALVDEILSELSHLKALGQYDSESEHIELDYDVDKQPIKSLCLHVAHDCNLRCRYCFAGTGEFEGERMLMGEQTAKQAIDFLIANSRNRRHLELDFFGGEPLMNFDVVKKTVEYGRERAKQAGKEINFTLTTNGINLNDEIIDYINENIFNIVISIDGRREVHDFMRSTVNGKPSYDLILDKAKKLISKRKGEYYIRGTFTANNLDFASDVLALYNAGFKNISIEPVVLDENEPYALTKEHLPKIFEEYERLSEMIIADKLAGGDLNFFHFSVDFSHGPCLKRRIKGCGAGFEYVAVAPNGDIYPCHQFVGNSEFIMGNVAEPYNFDREMQKSFMKCNILTKQKCIDCFAKYYCSGGCAANANKYNGSIYIPHEMTCELLKKRIECAMGIYAKTRAEE